MSGWGIDLHYRSWSLDDFGLGRQGWHDGGYLLTGMQGCGKSCLAGALIRDRMDPDHPRTLWRADYPEAFPKAAVQWHNARDLCDTIRASWQREGEARAIRALTSCSIVVIDDIGTERGTANQDAVNLPMIRRVIDRCVHNDVDLIVTTNLKLGEMGDPRLGSRLAMLDEIVLPDRDMRAAAKRARPKIQAKPCGTARANTPESPDGSEE